MKPTNAVWIQRVQCPCGDWKCFIRYEGNEKGQASQSTENGTSSLPSSELVFTPYVGQTFKSDEEAFEHYSAFARKNGFSIRKARSTESQNLGVYRRDFVCYRSGFNQPRKKADVEHPRERKSVRCGCDAKLYLIKEIVNGLPQWYISQFSNVHNHELLEDDRVRLLPAYRKMQEADQERILLLSRAGFPVNKIIKVLELEKGVQSGKLPFIEKDIRNFVHSCKKTSRENDIYFTEKRVADMLDLLEACKALAEKDVDFSFDFTADAKGNVENITWSYGDSVRAFNNFGDVVQFDMTYQSVIYGLLLGVFSGIDNHGKPIFFAFVLLQEISSLSIAWALQTFVQFMRGRHPQTIVTDLDLRLKDAIANEFPNTKHVVSLWYIKSKLSSWFSLPLGLQYSVFRSEFEILCYLDSIKDFETHWNHLVARFGLGSDKHISLLTSFKESWAFSYIKECFLARIVTTEYMESLCTCLYDILNVQTCLQGLFEQTGHTASCRYQPNEEMRFIQLKTCMPIEEHAQTLLTPYAFRVFQHELALSTQYATTEISKESYIIRHYKKTEGEYFVIWVSEEDRVHCSCKGFEHSGILCRHALRLLDTKNYFQVPGKYFPFRWRRDSSLLPLDEETIQTGKEGNHYALRTLTDTLLEESLMSKARSKFVQRELTTLLDRVKNISDHDVASEMTSNNFSET
ncbi:putative protein FAR1-RELATED SEQUENCE 10 [Silene latifolia]|uniref:putative protein FAR1-RELATED SEQUENCE 10 n=1 Tax=Silene latifolia TaxID=37657 RepID=UPI003D77307E